MKTLSKTFAVLLSCLMVMSLMPLTAGADVLTKEQLAEGFSWSEDFENFTQQTVYDDWTIQLTGEGKTSYTLNEGLYHEGDGSHISYDIVNGVFGKDDNDAALKFTSQVFGKDLTNDRFEQAYPVQFGSSAEMRFYRSQEMEYSATSAAGLASYNDAAIHYSTEFALENMIASRTITFAIDLYGDGGTETSASLGTSARSRLNIIKFTGTGANTVPAVIALGAERTIDVKQKTWHKLDFVVYSDLGMDLYIDGVKINDAKYYPASGNAVAPLRGVGVFRWISNNNRSTSSAGYQASPVYFDNTSANLLYDAPVISEYNPSYDTTKLYLDMENTEETKGSFVPEATLGNSSAADKLNTTFLGVSGVLGKVGKVYEISNTAESVTSNPYIQLGNATYTVANNLVTGDKVRIAFSIANKAPQKSTRYVSVNGMDKVLLLKGRNANTFHNVAFDCDVSEGKWNNFEIIYTKGETNFLADLYVNGVKACDTVTVDKTLTSFDNIRIGYEGLSYKGEDGETTYYKADGIYLDDLMFEKYAGGNFTVSPVSITKGSEILSSTIAEIEPGVNVTVGEFKSSVTISGADSYKFVNENGVEKTDEDMAEGGYLVINTSDKRVIFYELTSWEPDDEFDFNSTEFEGVSKVSMELNKVTIQNETAKTGHTFSTVSGLAEKSSEDKALVMTTTDFNSTEQGSGSRDPYIRFKFAERETNAFCAEFSMLLSGNGFDDAYVLVSTYQGETNSGVVPLRFYSDGRITLKGTEGTIGRWEENRWYRIGISADPSKDTIDVYLNGKKYTIPTGFDIANGNLTFANFRVSVEYPSNKTVSGTLALDDFRLYSDAYIGDGEAIIKSKDTANYFINENVIYTKSAPLAFDLPSVLDYNSKTVIYTDDTYTETVSGFAAIPDNAIMLTKNGYVSNYYKIKKLDSNYTPEIYFDGRTSDVLKSANIRAEVCTNLTGGGKLILAAYFEDKLSKVITADIPAGFAVTKTESIRLGNNLDGVTVKAFTIDSNGTFKPVTKTAKR